MKKILYKVLSLTLILGFSVGFLSVNPVLADDEESTDDSGGTSISISPVSNVLDLSSGSNYDDTMDIKNDGSSNMEVEVYAAPYSYVYAEDEDAYKLGFNNENNYTQITRWIKFKDASGNWVEKANYIIGPGDTQTVEYRITTPDSIPAGGQYAVIFAHTLSSSTLTNGIKTEASPGLVVYGRSTEGETIISAEISDLKVELRENEESKHTNFFGYAKVKNTGNVDFSAVGKLKVEPIIGGGSYETSGNDGRISIIPEAELVVTDEWKDSPSFGIYKVTWEVKAGEETEKIERIIFVNPLPFIIIMIILLTILTIWIIIRVRKRKERQARLAV